MKTNKAFKKRVKVTRKGKLVVRAKGQNHYNAKESGREGISKRKTQKIQMTKRAKRRFLSNI